jgi:ferritin-like protein
MDLNRIINKIIRNKFDFLVTIYWYITFGYVVAKMIERKMYGELY